MSRSLRPTPRPGVMAIESYVQGKSAAPGAAKVWKLSANETPLGPSPLARQAFIETAQTLELYPDGSASKLRQAIGERYGLDPARIVCGSGSDELLHLLASAYLGPGDEGLITQYGFLVYKIAILAAGATPITAPERDLTVDVDAILAAVTPKTKLVFLANPGNPSGTYIPFDDVKRLHAGLRPDIVLVLDAAYADYARRNDYESGLELVATADNVVMTRTFSKIHGLAALRVGWMFGPPAIVEAVNRIRGPFNVNQPALAAAEAAIRDTVHMEKAFAHNATWIAWLTQELKALGLKPVPSAANFILFEFPNRSGKSAAEADRFLTERGLILRNVASYGLPNFLRVTVGPEEANRLVIEALRDFLEG